MLPRGFRPRFRRGRRKRHAKACVVPIGIHPVPPCGFDFCFDGSPECSDVEWLTDPNSLGRPGDETLAAKGTAGYEPQENQSPENRKTLPVNGGSGNQPEIQALLRRTRSVMIPRPPSRAALGSGIIVTPKVRSVSRAVSVVLPTLFTPELYALPPV